ncbi:hypothetical protein [Leeuwenhoekiella sp. H156]|uniref:hypothetical protein n=1 Tax=Leeuwenhoekiella sp. H156 TaxID=3450128 RepID=UPI003FA40CBB
MKYLSLSLFLILLSGATYAQIYDVPGDYIRNTLSGKNSVPTNVIGSQYIDESFKIGTVHTGEKSFKSMIRYNAYRDEFEVKNELDKISSLLRLEDSRIEIGNKTYEIFEYINNNEKRKAYFSVLNSGINKLLLKEDVELLPGQEAQSTYGTDKPPRFKETQSYYLKLNGKPAEYIRLGKRNILKIISDKEFKNFVKANDLNLSEEEDVIESLEFLNS